jgi:formamidopyrimidine-DNA glycosylase
MPELPEVELYRRLAERALGRAIASIDAPDEWYLKGGLTADLVSTALAGRTFVAARRRGKLLLLDCSGDDGPVLGLRFGMSGRLIVDGVAGVDDLLYSSNRELEQWDRFVVRFVDGGALRMRDPRRLGGVSLDPDEARLMDQSRVAGVGNLIADEALWRAGLDPARAAGSLSPAEVRRLQRHVVATVGDFVRNGGSHTGVLLPHRVAGGRCPRDGTPLIRRTIGGRTTWSCPGHQR